MQSFNTESQGNAEHSENVQNFPVCSTSELEPGACRRFALPNGDELAIYNVNGEYYAIDNLCPHRGAPLSEGAVFDYVVECGLHGWQFDVRTGECLTVTERIRTYKVRVVDGMVLVEVNSQ